MANFLFIDRLGINVDQIRFVVHEDNDDLSVYFAPKDFIVLKGQRGDHLRSILHEISSEAGRVVRFRDAPPVPKPKESPEPKPAAKS